jgi:hypothetical protein
MTSGRAFGDKNLGEKVKRGKGERGESLYQAIFSFSPLFLFPFSPVGIGRRQARGPGTLVWN